MMFAITGVGIKDYLGDNLDSNFKKLLVPSSTPKQMLKSEWLGYDYDVTLSTENVYSISPIVTYLSSSAHINTILLASLSTFSSITSAYE